MSANFEYYKVFYHVAKCLNITHAADELRLTQPSVSKLIQNLERQLDCQLFTRLKKGVRLTPEGVMLFQKIKPACQTFFSAEEDIGKLKSLEAGVVNISTNDLALKHILLPILEKYRKLFPLVNFTIERYSPSDVPMALSTGRLDLFLDFDMDTKAAMSEHWMGRFGNDASALKDLEVTRQVFRTFLDIPIVGDKLAFLADREVSLKELFSYPLILPKNDTYSKNFYKDLFKKHGLERDVEMEVSGVGQRILMTQKNFGISFLPHESVELDIHNKTIFPLRLREKLLERQMILMTSQGRSLSLAAKSFINMLYQ